MSDMNSKGLVIFSGTNCPACIQAAQWLTFHKIPFQKIEIDGNLELIRRLGMITKQNTIPQFFLNGDWIPDGWTGVQKHARAGSLTPT